MLKVITSWELKKLHLTATWAMIDQFNFRASNCIPNRLKSMIIETIS